VREGIWERGYLAGWPRTRSPYCWWGPSRMRASLAWGKGSKTLCVPLTATDDVVGVLSVSNKKSNGNLTQEDLDRLVELSKPAARMIVLTLSQREADGESRVWERKQLAQEIHDGPMQELSSVILLMELYKRIRKDDHERADALFG